MSKRTVPVKRVTPKGCEAAKLTLVSCVGMMVGLVLAALIVGKKDSSLKIGSGEDSYRSHENLATPSYTIPNEIQMAVDAMRIREREEVEFAERVSAGPTLYDMLEECRKYLLEQNGTEPNLYEICKRWEDTYVLDMTSLMSDSAYVDVNIFADRIWNNDIPAIEEAGPNDKDPKTDFGITGLPEGTIVEPNLDPMSPISPLSLAEMAPDLLLMVNDKIYICDSLGTYRVTAYCPCKKCCGKYADGMTANGHKITVKDRFVAAPKDIPFNTRLYIKGYNENQPVKVLDRGGVIKDKRLDVFFPTHQEALDWGVRYIEVFEVK